MSHRLRLAVVYLSEALGRSGGNAGVWPLPSPYLGFRFLCYSDPKDGLLPMPDDYRVTWRSDDRAIYIRTHHALLARSLDIAFALDTLLRPFNASTAGDFDGDVIERWDFGIEVDAPTGPKKDRTLPRVERLALEVARRAAAMERAGFPADDIDFVRDFFAAYATVAE